MIQYLTEQSLGDYLKLIYPDNTFIHNRKVPDSVYAYIPDYRCEELKLIVEFDGHLHYTQARTCILDEEKDLIWRSLGYKTIRIPYFVQMCTESIEHYFGKKVIIEQTYPHGFIDEKCILPADFCSLGWKKFSKMLWICGKVGDAQSMFQYYLGRDIMDSLKEKYKVLKNAFLVIPNTDYGLLKVLESVNILDY